MRVLVFHILDQIYSLDSRDVIEVLPLVKLQPLLNTAEYISGILNYHARLLPTIDLSMFLAKTPSKPGYNTRILVMQLSLEDQVAEVALIVEKVIGISDLGENIIHAPLKSIEMVNSEYGPIQLIRAGRLLSKEALPLSGSLKKGAAL